MKRHRMRRAAFISVLLGCVVSLQPAGAETPHAENLFENRWDLCLSGVVVGRLAPVFDRFTCGSCDSSGDSLRWIEDLAEGKEDKAPVLLLELSGRCLLACEVGPALRFFDERRRLDLDVVISGEGRASLRSAGEGLVYELKEPPRHPSLGSRDSPWQLGTETEGERAAGDLLSLTRREEMRGSKEGKGAFDPNACFTVLSHLSMEPGCVLDCRCVSGASEAGPELVARWQGATRAEDAGTREDTGDAFQFVMADGTPQGYLELMNLRLVGARFFPYWHAELNEAIPICGRRSLESLGRASGIGLGTLTGLAEPKIRMAPDTVSISLLTFNRWFGVARVSSTFQRALPHSLLTNRVEVLVPYNSTGVRMENNRDAEGMRPGIREEGAMAEVRLVLRALDFAADRHRDQRRKDQRGSPYVNHLITVARLLADTGGVTDPVVLAAAVLHDTVEDVGVSFDEIENSFGPAVRAVVAEVTDDKSLDKDTRKRLQVEHAPHLSPEAKLVKLADKIANLHDVIERPPVGWSRQRREQYVRWSSAVVDGCRGASPELEALFDSLRARAAVSIEPGR